MSDVNEIKPVTRIEAVNSVIAAIQYGCDNCIRAVDLCERAENAVVDSGGKPNPDATVKLLKKTLKVAVGLGVLKLDTTVIVERIA